MPLIRQNLNFATSKHAQILQFATPPVHLAPLARLLVTDGAVEVGQGALVVEADRLRQIENRQLISFDVVLQCAPVTAETTVVTC